MPLAAAALAFALFGAHPHAPRSPTRVERRLYGVGAWRLLAVRDPFADTTRCRLGKRDAEVEDGRLVWRLGPEVDTSAAVWRIDAGAPRFQRLNDLPASANLDNPSDGRLAAPVDLLAGARAIETRPTPEARVRRLAVARLDEALAAAAAQGCAPL